MVHIEFYDGSVAQCGNLSDKKDPLGHDIPYLAGYSRDAKTIYIDLHMTAPRLIGTLTLRATSRQQQPGALAFMSTTTSGVPAKSAKPFHSMEVAATSTFQVRSITIQPMAHGHFGSKHPASWGPMRSL
jgi:hypothetical protein